MTDSSQHFGPQKATSRTPIVALVGNPNSGKTTLFNALTGAHQRTGNWPGVTVERKTGDWRLNQRSVELLDLPGTYSLDTLNQKTSMDEQIAQQSILRGDADLYLNIVDASNLSRNLFLTLQLREMGIPVIVVLNMIDVATRQGLSIDQKALSETLGCPVVAVSAARKSGLDALEKRVEEALESLVLEPRAVSLPAEHQSLHKTLAAEVAAVNDLAASSDWLALRLMEQDPVIHEWFRQKSPEAYPVWAEKLDELDVQRFQFQVSEGRYKQIDELLALALQDRNRQTVPLTERIDRIVLHRFLGFPIFLLVMYLMFLFAINVGSAFIDFFDILAGTLFVDGFAAVLESLGSPDWLVAFLANGVGGGIQLVASFIPVIGAMFLFLSWLEDSGYMARAAFVVDRVMRAVGLPGKAFVPLIVGFGCNVPAIMATRTLERERDRITAILMAPFMSCGARLSVYALFAAAFFPKNGHNIVFLLYLTGIGIAVLSAWLMKKTLLQGESGHFIMELPQYHWPTLRNILIRSWDRLKGFILRAGKAIVMVVVILNVINSLGTDGTFGHENTEKSVLSVVGKAITPVFEPMGLREDNWPATVGIFTGIFAKEVVVGTLDSLYSNLDSDGTEAEEAFSLWGGIQAAFQSVPENLRGLKDQLLDPLGLSVVGSDSLEAAAEEQEVSTSTFGAMQARFDGAIGAFAYLLFVLLYIPCVATIGAIYRELDRNWSIFITAWTLGSGYGVATLFYQLATWHRHPMQSAAWATGIALALVLVIIALRRRARLAEHRQDTNLIIRSGG